MMSRCDIRCGMSVRFGILAGFALLILATTSAVAWQPPPGQGRGGRGGAGQTIEKIRPLKPNLYMVTGGGANTLVRVTPDGLIVVDTKNPGDENFNRLMEEIRSVSNLPVKYVINTQHHPDHVGTNQKFIDAGATVIALDALKTHMAGDPRTKEIPGLPTQTFAKDYTLKFGGAEVRLYSFGRGHSAAAPWAGHLSSTASSRSISRWRSRDAASRKHVRTSRRTEQGLPPS
jgi:hypothetical protein